MLWHQFYRVTLKCFCSDVSEAASTNPEESQLHPDSARVVPGLNQRQALASTASAPASPADPSSVKDHPVDPSTDDDDEFEDPEEDLPAVKPVKVWSKDRLSLYPFLLLAQYMRLFLRTCALPLTLPQMARLGFSPPNSYTASRN